MHKGVYFGIIALAVLSQNKRNRFVLYKQLFFFLKSLLFYQFLFYYTMQINKMWLIASLFLLILFNTNVLGSV